MNKGERPSTPGWAGPPCPHVALGSVGWGTAHRRLAGRPAAPGMRVVLGGTEAGGVGGFLGATRLQLPRAPGWRPRGQPLPGFYSWEGVGWERGPDYYTHRRGVSTPSCSGHTASVPWEPVLAERAWGGGGGGVPASTCGVVCEQLPLLVGDFEWTAHLARLPREPGAPLGQRSVRRLSSTPPPPKCSQPRTGGSRL